MLETKYPFEFELTPVVSSAQTEFQSYAVKLKNTGQGTLVNLQVRLHLIASNRESEKEIYAEVK